VHFNSDRTGVRLEGPKPQWARTDGGEAGLHPSNIHDNAYCVGTLDFTGDTPILLGPDGPSLGGFVCPVTVVRGDRWKLGQMAPGDTVRFVPVRADRAPSLGTIDAGRRAWMPLVISTAGDDDDGVLARFIGSDDTAVTVRRDGDDVAVTDDELGDVCGHGTACAGIIRSIAPGARLHSVRVLGSGATGAADLILAGLRQAIEARHRVISLSLSTTKRRFAEELHELADLAYFNRTVIVASAHNLPVDSYPWRFSSVVSVGSHEEPDALAWYANPNPPVELFARGVDVEVAWLGGATLRCTGNSFAAPHIAGVAALVLAKHPELTPYQLKSVLHLTATNAGGAA
jgi:subtilisin family serine protease